VGSDDVLTDVKYQNFRLQVVLFPLLFFYTYIIHHGTSLIHDGKYTLQQHSEFDEIRQEMLQRSKPDTTDTLQNMSHWNSSFTTRLIEMSRIL